MEVSKPFIKNKFEVDYDKNYVALEVGIDKENLEQNRLNLIVQLTNTSKYLELVFYFNVTNKDRTKITSSPSYIYDRNDIKKYLPKELIGKNIFKQKINKMAEDLINKKKPKRFFLITYEDYKDEKQISYYNDLVDLMLNNGYHLSSKGVTADKRYQWEFTEKTLEEVELAKLGYPIRDEQYLKDMDRQINEVMQDFLKVSRENGD